MTALSEAQLIEIARRFEWLELAIESADLILVEREESFRRRADNAEDEWKRNTNPERAEGLRSRMAIAKLDAAHIHDVRDRIEHKLEACQEDLRALLEQVRQPQ